MTTTTTPTTPAPLNAERLSPSLLGSQMATMVLVLFCALKDRATHTSSDADEREAGVTTLEIAVIALGLFLLAGVLVAVITAAVNRATSQIN